MTVADKHDKERQAIMIPSNDIISSSKHALERKWLGGITPIVAIANATVRPMIAPAKPGEMDPPNNIESLTRDLLSGWKALSDYVLTRPQEFFLEQCLDYCPTSPDQQN